LGWVCAALGADGRLRACALGPTKAAALAACGVRRADPSPEGPLKALRADLARYFAGERVDLGRHPVDLSGQPPFHRGALLAAREIPYGEVRTYGWVAARAGNPSAARAAGAAMSRNPIGLFIPCHRVVGAGGDLTGFGGGLPLKRALLALEGVRIGGRRCG